MEVEEKSTAAGLMFKSNLQNRPTSRPLFYSFDAQRPGAANRLTDRNWPPAHTQMLQERRTLPEAITEQRKEKPQGDKGVKTSGQQREDGLYNSCLEETRRVRLALLCVTVGKWCLVQKADGLCCSFRLILLERCH